MKPSDYVRKAKELRKNRECVEASNLLKQGLKKYPCNTLLYNNLILSYGEYRITKAVETFDYVLDNDLEDIYTCNIMLNIFTRKKYLKDAENLFCFIKENFKNENLEISYSTMLKAYVHSRNKEKTEKFFEEIKEKGFGNHITYNNMLQLHVKLKDSKKAENFFNEIVQKHFANSRTYSMMIDLYFNLNDYEKALKILEKTPLHHKDVTVLNHEIELHRRLNNHYKCLNLIEDLLLYDNLKSENRITLKLNKGFCLKNLKELNKARQIFREVYNEVRRDSPSYIRVITGLVFCDDVKENEVYLFTKELSDAIKNSKGRKHAVEAALNMLSRKGNEDKVKKIKPTIERKQMFNKH